MNIAFKAANILLPRKGVDMHKWSVVACDQFTSQPDYWQDVEQIVGDAPSTYKITLPEVFLEQPGAEERINKINAEMDRYVKEGVFCEHKDCLIYVERTLSNAGVRRGIVGAIDLEQYDYNPTATSLIRATEGTIISRIPPRVKVRKNAPVELPHVMLLIDDREDTIMSSLEAKKATLDKAYDFELMKDGGHICGYIINKDMAGDVFAAFEALCDPKNYNKKYGVNNKGTLLFAVGDGNHSLATAKECFEQIKKTMPKEQWEKHPARYALVEVVNLNDKSMQFEPIHRVVFEVDADDMFSCLLAKHKVSFEPCDGQYFKFISKDKTTDVWIKDPSSNLAVGTVQAFLDEYISKNGGRIDYIHGDDVVLEQGSKDGNVGILFGSFEKSDFFKTVLVDGVMPRKTFSLGHAQDKRYYLEARKII